MILREYLYVDVVAVRGLLAQLESGLEETVTTSDKRETKSGGGLKGFAEHAQSRLEDQSISKSLGDAMFPRLEDALEAEGLLADVSEDLLVPSVWRSGETREVFPPGRIIRFTAPGWLIDSRYVGDMLASFATTHRGLENMGITSGVAPDPVLPPKAKKGQPKRSEYVPLPDEEMNPEGRIPMHDLRLSPDEVDPVSGSMLRGIAQVTRGMYTPGVHLSLVPEVEGAGAITVRLQEGRQYLDSSPEVLFSRYGVGSQLWTVVGTVGHHPHPEADLSDTSWIEGGSVNRSRFGSFLTSLGANLAQVGFVDLAQDPGFSVVPWAVYRTLGQMDAPMAG